MTIPKFPVGTKGLTTWPALCTFTVTDHLTTTNGAGHVVTIQHVCHHETDRGGFTDREMTADEVNAGVDRFHARKLEDRLALLGPGEHRVLIYGNGGERRAWCRVSPEGIVTAVFRPEAGSGGYMEWQRVRGNGFFERTAFGFWDEEFLKTFEGPVIPIAA